MPAGGVCAGREMSLPQGRASQPQINHEIVLPTIRVVAELGEAAAAFQTAYPHIMSLWAPVRGLLFPEHFWDYGFEPKDMPRMLQEEKEAHKKSKVLEEKYSWYSDNNKRRIERVYREILAYVESVRVGA